jgi:Alpha-kinase family
MLDFSPNVRIASYCLIHLADYCCVALRFIDILVATKASDKLSPSSIANAKCWVVSPYIPPLDVIVYTFTTSDHHTCHTEHPNIEATIAAFSHFVYSVLEGQLVYDNFACT